MIRIVFIFGIVFLSTASFGQTIHNPYKQADNFSRIDVQSIKRYNPDLFINILEPKVEPTINSKIRTTETEEESNMPILDLSKNISSNMPVKEFFNDFHSNMPIVGKIRVGISIQLDGIKK